MTNPIFKSKKLALGLGVGMALFTMTGCGSADQVEAAKGSPSASVTSSGTVIALADKVKAASGLPSASVMSTGTVKVLEEQNIKVADSGLKCTVNVGDGNITKAVTGDCSGVDTNGGAVTSTLLNGKYSDVRDSCTATLVTKSADKVIKEVTDFNCAA